MDPRDLAAALALLVAAASLAFAWTRRARPRHAEDAEHLHDRIWRISESEDRYRALVEATTDVIVQRDAQGRITFANAGYAALFDRTPLALIGATLDLDVLETGGTETGPDGVRRIEARVLPADGVPRWFAFIEIPVARGPEPIQWLRAGRDVTGRIESARALDVALARAESASIAKSRFLATVSHEFRTPLNGILGMADLVLDTTLDGEQRTYVQAVRTSGQALLSLIDGILDFSRIEAGRIDLATEPFDLPATAEAVVELLAPRAQDKGIEIALDVADDVPVLVVGDADRVRQILVNLVGNAIKFTQDGGVGVTVGRAGSDLVLSIADTGPGIAADRIALLFEEFEQGDGSASRSHEGTGLGLAITRRLVARMGGRIETESKLGRGSTFRVSLPLAAAETQAAAPARPVLSARKVLIVADSPFQAPYLAKNLARSGAAAVIVPNLRDGLDALAGVGFDAVIADRALGDDAVRRLADEARACGVRCSLVLLSPFDRREFGAPGAAGFDTYLIKPVRARSLFDRLLAPAPTVAPEAAPRPPARAGAGLRVLLAEDNPINALLATKALERLGAEVVHAADGLEALARIADAPAFDLALIDIRMPNLDGHETARRIRAAEARDKGARLHLVALTANAGREDEKAARKAGFDGFLAKPLDLKLLPGLLERRTAQAA
ncbi:ATP-binding protein [uncultured Methylobacterium sp.]|uniref:ATP-binding protein n=1 Tax=uncultured Methylobacterium sp. TaxID=157278 RepID=UPI0035CADEA9